MNNKKVVKHYCSNKELYSEMCHYKAQYEQFKRNEITKEPRMSDAIGLAIIQICTNLAVRANFSGYTYKDEMIADAIENCVFAAKSFDPDKTNNPFAYFTMVAWNAFIRRISKEKRQTYIKHKNFEASHLKFELEGELSTGSIGNEYSHDVIRQFEDKLAADKIKKKNAVGLEKFVDESSNGT